MAVQLDVDILEQESGMGSSRAGDLIGGSSEETSSLLWSSTNSYESGCEDEFDSHSDGYGTDTSLHSFPGQPPTTLHWVRMSSLRIHDNASLSHAMSNSQTRFRAVFIVDPWFATGERRFGVNRWRFLLECLHDLDKRLRSYNTRLYVAKGHPLAVMERLCRRWNVTELTFQVDCEVRSHVVEEAVEKLAEQLDIKVTKKQGHTLYDTAMLLEKAGHDHVATIKDFKEVLVHVGKPDVPVEPPPVPLTSYEDQDGQASDEFQIPSLQDLGFPEDETLYSNEGGWIGGESVALERLVEYCSVRSKPPTNSYVDMLFDKTSLSPYIRFGCLSVRYFLCEVRKLASKDPSMEPLLKDVTGKLLQREFYFTVAKQVPNFDCYDNHISFHLPWEEDNHLFTLWKNGRTGYPWIDAAMKQLQKEGWIHLCLRESVASFLTRGDLWISWVWGKDTFEELMLDFEVTVSSGCWMKSSCSAFITGPVEHFCPVTFGKQIDPTGVYIRTYCPELKSFPDEYIYCPWMAPLEVQKAAGCQIGIDYPNPIIDHSTAGFLCCEKLRSVMDMVQRGSPEATTAAATANVQRTPTTNHTHHLQHEHQLSMSSLLMGIRYQQQRHRFHPYSRLEYIDLASRPTMHSSERRGGADDGQRQLSSNWDGKNIQNVSANSGRAQSCPVCTSTDTLLTQVLSECQARGNSQGAGLSSSTSSSHRLRRINLPSNCSHRHSNFTTFM